jgi:hypothetical protein
MAFREQYSWLYEDKVLLSDTSPFRFQRSDVTALENFYRLLYGNIQFCQQEIQALADSYHSFVNANPSVFSEQIDPTTTTGRIHADLMRTIAVLRTAENLEYTKPTDAVRECFARILLYADRNGVGYRQGWGDLLIPIYQIIFCGIAGISTVPPDPPLVEGLAACSFVRFMLDPPFAHLKFVPPHGGFEDKVTAVETRLRTYDQHEGLSLNQLDCRVFCNLWFILLFMQALPLRDVLFVWKNAFEKMRAMSMSLHDCWVDYSVTVAVWTLRKCVGKGLTQTQIYQALQNPKDLTGGVIVAKLLPIAPGKRNRKKSRSVDAHGKSLFE